MRLPEDARSASPLLTSSRDLTGETLPGATAAWYRA